MYIEHILTNYASYRSYAHVPFLCLYALAARKLRSQQKIISKTQQQQEMHCDDKTALFRNKKTIIKMNNKHFNIYALTLNTLNFSCLKL